MLLPVRYVALILPDGSERGCTGMSKLYLSGQIGIENIRRCVFLLFLLSLTKQICVITAAALYLPKQVPESVTNSFEDSFRSVFIRFVGL